jgi:hypothetical protein
MPPTSSNEEWVNGRNPTIEMDFDALTNVVASSVVGCDEMELGNQMAVVLNDVWQTCGVTMDQSNRPNGDLDRQTDFNMDKPLEFYYNVVESNVEKDNVDFGAYGPTQPKFDFKINNLHYLKLAIESNVALYEGCAHSRLIGTLMILNTCATHHYTNGFVDELLSLLKNFMLPKPNNLFNFHYEAMNLIQNLGLGYLTIHACENDCVLYHNEHMALE